VLSAAAAAALPCPALPSAAAAIRDPVEAWERHIEDSLALLPVIEQYACSSSNDSSSSSSSSSSGLSVIDVGTGAGLPGMVLAVVRPDWQVSRQGEVYQGFQGFLGLEPRVYATEEGGEGGLSESGDGSRVAASGRLARCNKHRCSQTQLWISYP